MPRPKHANLQVPETIARRVRLARLQKGWSQEQLAEKLDVATETISRYEVGRVPPSLPMLYRMAKALGVEVEWLLGKAPTNLTLDETQLVERWRLLDPKEQSMVRNLVEHLSNGRAGARTAARARTGHAPPDPGAQK